MQLLSLKNRHRIKKNYFSIAVIVFISSFYYAPSSKFLNNTYYILVLFPFCIYSVIHYRQWLNTLIQYRFYAGLCVTLILSSLINGIEMKELGHQFTRLLYVTGFIGALAIANNYNSKLPTQILRGIVYGAFFGAILCLYLTYFIDQQSISYRLRGVGALDNPILLSSIHGAAILSALYIGLTLKNKFSWIYFFLILPSIAIVFLTQSRGPLLALVITSLVCVFWVSSKHLKIVTAITTMLVGCLLVTTALILENTDNRLMSLDGPRPAIWGQTLEKIYQKPIIGYGLQKTTTINAELEIKNQQQVVVKVINMDFQHPHNVYLTTLLHGGILALILLITLIINVLVSIKRVNFYHFLLVFGLIYILFDGSRLFASPRELWFIIWLPIGMLLAMKHTKVDVVE